MRGGLTPRVALASTALVVLIAGAFVVLLLALDSTRDSGELARHSRLELDAAYRLERLVLDLETGQRGFVITSEPRFLGPWRLARRTIPDAGGRLLSLADDRAQRRRAARIVSAVESYVSDYSVPLVAAASRGDPEAASVATTLRGERLLDSLRSRFNTYLAAERDLLAERQADSDSDAHLATVIAIAGLVGSVVLILLFAAYLTRSIVLPIRRAAGMAGRISGGELSARMPETGIGEVGMLEASFNTMAASLEQSQAELERYAEDQAALRRVATLVARDVPPGELLESVAREVTEVLGSDSTGLLRYEPDGGVAVLATWAGPALPGEPVVASVLATGRPASTDGDDGRRTLGAPIFVAGRLWGVMVTTWARERARPEGVEARMAEFTELVATAVANAESRAELAASRARVVAAADEARRRIERDLHDGTQQRLVTLGLRLRASESLAPAELTELRGELASAVESLTSAVEELQEISRGIHPAILSRGGLAPALRSLARRSSVPVDLELDVERRLPEQVEVATYYVVSEALTNAAKHSQASTLRVRAGADDGVVSLSIVDDGVGGADPAGGSGLVGLRDRVEALGGELRVSSAPGEGTALDATIPIPLGE